MKIIMLILCLLLIAASSTTPIAERAFRSINTTTAIGNFIDRKGIAPDENYNWENHPELQEGLAAEDLDGFAGTQSYAEGKLYIETALQENEDFRILCFYLPPNNQCKFLQQFGLQR
jgi:hypothetical protein